MEGVVMAHQWEVGKEYKMRNGETVEIMDVNYRGLSGQSILGKIKRYNYDEVITWGRDGSFASEKRKHGHDLMPPVETKELWINVYGEFGGWSNKELADKQAASARIGLVKITITGDEFEVEKVAI